MAKLNKQTIFVHIPKTAGTTLRAIIENLFHKNKICCIYHGNRNYLGMDDFHNLTDAEKGQYEIFIGHFGFGMHNQLPQECNYITVLRDPVERTVSLYHHHLQESHSTEDKNVAEVQSQMNAKGHSLKDFVATGISYLNTDNGQTRLLAGEAPAFGACSAKTLELAKNHLQKHFAVSGLTERFDESLFLLHKTLGWPMPFYTKRNVATLKKEKCDYDKSTINILREHNELDLELYAFANQLFDEQIKSLGDGFKNELSEYKNKNLKFQEKKRILQLAKNFLMKLSHSKNR